MSTLFNVTIAFLCLAILSLVCILVTTPTIAPHYRDWAIIPPNCPDVAVQRGGVFELYDSRDPDRAPLFFTDVDQFNAYLHRQRFRGLACPRITIRQEHDFCGRRYFREDSPYTRGIPNQPSEHIDYTNRHPDRRKFKREPFLPTAEEDDAPDVTASAPTPSDSITFNFLHRFVPFKEETKTETVPSSEKEPQLEPMPMSDSTKIESNTVDAPPEVAV